MFAGCLEPEGEGAASLRLQSNLIVILKCDVTQEDQVKEAFEIVSQKLQESNRRFFGSSSYFTAYIIVFIS